MKKFDKFAFNVTGLTEYVDQTQQELKTRAVAAGKTLPLIQILPNIKGTQKLHLLDETITWQNGAACVVNAAGDTVLSDRDITVADIALVKSYCVKDLVNYFPQISMAAGAMDELKDLPFEAQLVEYVLLKHQNVLENAIWKGDTTLSNNYQFFDGFAKKLNASADVIEANTAGLTAITVANAYSAVLAAARALPEAVIETGEAALFCGRATFDKVKDNLFNINNNHVPVANDNVMSMVIPSTGITLYSVPGLNETNYIYGGRRSSFIFGTDLESDYAQVEAWYEKKDDSIFIRNRFRGGIQFPFDNEMVKFTLALS
jgi:hypothetical protein